MIYLFIAALLTLSPLPSYADFYQNFNCGPYLLTIISGKQATLFDRGGRKVTEWADVDETPFDSKADVLIYKGDTIPCESADRPPKSTSPAVDLIGVDLSKDAWSLKEEEVQTLLDLLASPRRVSRIPAEKAMEIRKKVLLNYILNEIPVLLARENGDPKVRAVLNALVDSAAWIWAQPGDNRDRLKTLVNYVVEALEPYQYGRVEIGGQILDLALRPPDQNVMQTCELPLTAVRGRKFGDTLADIRQEKQYRDQFKTAVEDLRLRLLE